MRWLLLNKERFLAGTYITEETVCGYLLMLFHKSGIEKGKVCFPSSKIEMVIFC